MEDMRRFISLLRDSGDYTLSRRQLYDDITVDGVFESASAYMKEHPLNPETKARLEKYKNR